MLYNFIAYCLKQEFVFGTYLEHRKDILKRNWIYFSYSIKIELIPSNLLPPRRERRCAHSRCWASCLQLLMNLEYCTSHNTAADTGHALTSCGESIRVSKVTTLRSMNTWETSFTGVQTTGHRTFSESLWKHFLVFKDFPHKGTRG